MPGSDQYLTAAFEGTSDAKFRVANGYATVTIATTGVGATSTRWVSVSLGAPPAVLPGNLPVPGSATGTPAGGDLTSLQVRGDGSAMLVIPPTPSPWTTC